MGIVFSASAIAHADAAATELMNAVAGARLASLCAYKSRPRACQSLMQSFRTEISRNQKRTRALHSPQSKTCPQLLWISMCKVCTKLA